MAPSFTSEIVKKLPHYRDQFESVREVLLANVVMFGEIPAPTFDEWRRVEFIQQRFTESGLVDCSSDEVGNGLGIIRGESDERDERNILIVAHVDTNFGRDVDHTITVQPDRITGPGVGDNSLGVAMLASLPAILEQLNIRFKSNLVLMAAVKSLGRGNLEGLRFFLDNNKMPIQAGIGVEGCQLGRFSFSSIGMVRGEISCRVPQEYDWTRFGAAGAIMTLNEVINRMIEIPLPKRPRTSIVMGKIQGGTAFNTIAQHASLQFEIRSESGDEVKKLRRRIEEITEQVSSEAGGEVTFDEMAEREPGGIEFGHALPRRTRSIMKALDIEARISPSTSELSAFINRKIPAVTLGITSGENVNELDEFISIQPMATGLAQLLGVLLAIDRGYCDED